MFSTVSARVQAAASDSVFGDCGDARFVMLFTAHRATRASVFAPDSFGDGQRRAIG
jgi:hypothetical protein